MSELYPEPSDNEAEEETTKIIVNPYNFNNKHVNEKFISSILRGLICRINLIIWIYTRMPLSTSPIVRKNSSLLTPILNSSEARGCLAPHGCR